MQERDDAGLRDAGLRLEAKAAEPFHDVLRGLHFAIRQFRMLMQVAPPLNQLGLDRRGQLVDFDGE
ncbi:hypothetical protein D3C83_154860 [compost metagenome]